MTDWLQEIEDLPVNHTSGEYPTRGGSLLTELTKPDESISKLERIAKWKGHPVDDLLDWYRDDLQDLAAKSDKDLQAIVCEYLDNIALYRGTQVETFKPHTVTCETCQHFTRGNHPHLGSCAAGVKGALLGLWGTHLRGCDKYKELEK